jgi:hypothetical protein
MDAYKQMHADSLDGKQQQVMSNDGMRSWPQVLSNHDLLAPARRAAPRSVEMAGRIRMGEQSTTFLLHIYNKIN